MGRDKTDVMVRDRSMLDLVASALRPVVGGIVLLGPEREGWVCWPDAVHAQGPLAGIATALSRTVNDRVALIAVDHVFVRTSTLGALIDIESDLPVVPVDHAGIRQVTCALYPASIATAAVEEAGSGGSIQTLLDRVSFRPVTPDDWQEWGEDGRSWFSVDSEEDLAHGLAVYS
jgi:molybdopterin-guanine dinucleotide biosynthesis protein A